MGIIGSGLHLIHNYTSIIDEQRVPRTQCWTRVSLGGTGVGWGGGGSKNGEKEGKEEGRWEGRDGGRDK